jgi:lysozyme family protein
MSFQRAIDKTLDFEKGYSFITADSGGETFMGVSRRSFPKWDGWARVDDVKKTYGKTANTINYHLLKDVAMLASAKALYKKEFWDKIPDALPERIKEKVFDTCVNVGVKSGFIFLQKSLNALGSKLAEDGIIGPLTLAAVPKYHEQDILIAYSGAQRRYYVLLIKREPKNELFRKGWMCRADWIPEKE